MGGWQINGISTLQTGLTFTPTLNAATVNTGGGSRPDRIGSGKLDNPDPSRWFDTSAFATPAQFTYGNAGRNILYGPGRVNFDFSLFKDFRITESLKIQFRTEFFNLFNTPQFDLPNATIGSGPAGTITSIVGIPRQISVWVKACVLGGLATEARRHPRQSQLSYPRWALLQESLPRLSVWFALMRRTV